VLGEDDDELLPEELHAVSASVPAASAAAIDR